MDDDGERQTRVRRTKRSAETAMQTAEATSQSGASVTVSSSEHASSLSKHNLSKRSRAAAVITPNACTECRKKRAKVGTSV